MSSCAPARSVTCTRCGSSGPCGSDFAASAQPRSCARPGALMALTGVSMEARRAPTRACTCRGLASRPGLLPTTTSLSGSARSWTPKAAKASTRETQGRSLTSTEACALTASPASPVCRKSATRSQAWMAALACASFVLAPRCGAATTFACLARRQSVGGSSSHTSMPAARRRFCSRASKSAAGSTRGPRAALTRMADGFMRASRAASMRWRVCAVSGVCRLTRSALARPSSRATHSTPIAFAASGVTNGSWPRTAISKAAPRAAIMRPMRPRPTRRRVLPASSTPSSLRSHLPCFMLASASGTRRAQASMSAHACSAADVMLPVGAWKTATPRAGAAARSTLSTPTPARPTARSLVAAAMSSARMVVPLRTIHASALATSAWRAGPSSLVPSTTSWPRLRRRSRPSASSGSVTRMRATPCALRQPLKTTSIEDATRIQPCVAASLERGRAGPKGRSPFARTAKWRPLTGRPMRIPPVLLAACLSFLVVAGCLDASEDGPKDDGPDLTGIPSVSVNRLPDPGQESEFAKVVVGDHGAPMMHTIRALHGGAYFLEQTGWDPLVDKLPPGAAGTGWGAAGLWQDYACVAQFAGTGAIAIVDISDPADLVVTAQVDDPLVNGDCQFTADGNYLIAGAYLAGAEYPDVTEQPLCPHGCPAGGGINVWDVHDKADPQHILYENTGEYHTLQVHTDPDTNFTYVVQAYSGHIYRFDPDGPALTEVFTITPMDHDMWISKHPITGKWLLYTGYRSE